MEKPPTRTRLSYVSPSGLQFFLREGYLWQRGEFTEFDETYTGPFTTNAPTTDVNVRWDWPRKRGFVSFSVTDLTQKRYEFLRNPLAEHSRIPRNGLCLASRRSSAITSPPAAAGCRSWTAEWVSLTPTFSAGT